MLAARQDRAVESRASLVKAAEEVLRVAVRVDDALPDKERQLLYGADSSHMPALVMSFRQRWDAFGGDAAEAAKKESEEIQARRLKRIPLTPLNIMLWEIGAAWLAWLKQQNDGPRDFRLIRAWGRGVPIVVIARRSGQSDDTIHRRRRAAIEAIISRPKFRRELDALALADA